jgi:hypothetical protein
VKHAKSILWAGLILALIAYFGGYFAGTAKHRAMLQSDAPELAWLKKEFNLSDAEFQRISELHDAYLPGCAERCARIDATNAVLKELLYETGDLTFEVKQKLADAAALRLECQTAMLSHFLAVSKAMPPEQGKRYLSWIGQRTFMPEHSMARHH